MESNTKNTFNSISDNDTVDISALIRALIRGKFWIILFFLLGIGSACLYIIFLAVPTYVATSVVVMESRESQLMGLDVESILGSLSNDSSVVNTEVEVLRGRLMMGRVVDELHLVDDPEFNLSLNTPSPILKIKSFIFGSDKNISSESQLRDNIVTELLKKVKTVNIPQSLAFQIQVETASAEKSALIADTIAGFYIDDQVRVKFEATKRAAEWLADEAAKLKTELENSEGEFRRYQSDMSIASADELAAMDRQLKDTRDRRAASEGEVKALTARQADLSSATALADQAAALADPQLIEAATAAERGDSNALTAFDARRELLVQQMTQDILRLRGQIDSYMIAEKNLIQSINRGSQELTRLDQMLREAEASKLLYEHFQTRLKETVAQQGIQQPDSRVLSQAVRPSSEATPRKGVILSMAGLLGIGLGAGLVLLRETAARSIRTANDLENLSGRVVLGQIPIVPKQERGKLLRYLSEHPTSAVAEAVRNLRTSILLSDIDKSPQVICLTSSVPGEGKTTLTLALGQNLTLMGKKVLIIEGDIRRRTFKVYLNLPQKNTGLVSLLSGEVSLSEAAMPVLGLGDIILGEQTSVNAADLFSSNSFAQLLVEARKKYDIILIDTPPVLVVPDARIIVQHVDAVVFVVRWDHTPETQVQDSLHMLETINARISGMVLSQIDPKGMRRYGYGERYGAYAAYGKKYYTAE